MQKMELGPWRHEGWPGPCMGHLPQFTKSIEQDGKGEARNGETVQDMKLENRIQSLRRLDSSDISES